jgi:hypothetical protein
MHTLSKVSGVEIGGRLEAAAAASPAPASIPVPRALLRALNERGIETAGAVGRLTNEQLDKLLTGREIEQRILLKGLCLESGILPR